MRSLLVSMLAVSAVALLAGCPPTEDPDVDHWLRRGSEEVLFCVNGAFTAKLSTGTREGMWSENAQTTGVIITATQAGMPIFTFTRAAADADWSSPELGTDWLEFAVQEGSERDDVNARCTALESRAWWK